MSGQQQTNKNDNYQDTQDTQDIQDIQDIQKSNGHHRSYYNLLGFITGLILILQTHAWADIRPAAQARYLAGIPTAARDFNLLNEDEKDFESSAAWKQAVNSRTSYWYFDLKTIGGRANQLNKSFDKYEEIQKFLDLKIPEVRQETKHVLYQFGGPDFLYPDLLFPNMETLITVGQEKIGPIPNVEALARSGSLASRLQQIGVSLRAMPYRSYFVTSTMSREYQSYGVASILYASIALAGYEVVDSEYIALTAQGDVVPIKNANRNSTTGSSGIRIAYRKTGSDKMRFVYYFQQNLANGHVGVFRQFISNINIDTAFYKAASYIPQEGWASESNRISLQYAKYIVQGESGLPLRSFDSNWKVQLFGVYTRPYHSSEGVGPNWGFQADMKRLYNTLICSEKHAPAAQAQVQLVWGRSACAEASKFRSLPQVSWLGYLPFYFDYGSELASNGWREEASNLQVFEKIK